MQVKLSPKNVEPMLKSGEYEIAFQSENQIVVIKPFNYGMIHIRLKREKSRYSLQEHYYWLANISFQKSLRPKRFFNSKDVHEFAEKYVIPYAESK